MSREQTLAFDKHGNFNQPYVLMEFRFGPWVLPKPDSQFGPLDEQERLIHFWQDVWSKNEHPAYKHTRNTSIPSSLSNGLGQLDQPSSSKNTQSLMSYKHDNITGIKAAFTDSEWETEGVRHPMTHFLEDALFLEWALKNNLRVYGIAYHGRDHEDLNSILYSARYYIDRSLWTIDCETEWMVHKTTLNCVFALNCRGKPPVWKEGDPAIFYRTGQLERRIDGLKEKAENGNPVLWKSRFPDDNRSNLYYRSKTFQKYAGRPCNFSTLEDLPYHLYNSWILGCSKIFIKHTQAKRGVWILDLPHQDAKNSNGSSLKPVDLFNHFLSTFSSSIPRILSCYGNNGYSSFMVQGFVPFCDEYRFWVVDGKLVAGTPVRRPDTALADQKWVRDNPDQPWQSLSHCSIQTVKQGRFRPFLCADRESDGPHLARKRVSQYVRVARLIAKELWKDSKNISPQFVLDLGTDQRTGLILPIEVNGFNNAGSYGMPPHLIWQPILRIARSAMNKPEDKNCYFWLGQN